MGQDFGGVGEWFVGLGHSRNLSLAASFFPLLFGKFFDTLRVWENSAPSSHVYSGSYHEFNEWILP